ncbi:ornithine carbamoyltransferase [Candidatus Bipolaricaulota bacterium]|nr:ornithine carbamoyltransferase [Candidatus Bipolaricaulota bacterium]
MSTFFRGRHFITTEDFKRQQIDTLLDLSCELKTAFAHDQLTPWLLYKTVFMIFYDSSTRTRNSIEAGITQLGGHAHFLTPDRLQLTHGETPEDTAKVLSRFGHAIAIRACEYGKGNNYLNRVAEQSRVPVLNLQDDIYHPMQALADLMTIQERFGKDLRDLKVGISWAYADSHLKPLSVPQSQILLFARYGMDVTLAHPKGFELTPEIVAKAKENAANHGGKISISHDMDDAFNGADVVIPKNWGGFFAAPSLEEIGAKAKQHTDWICDERRMNLTNRGSIYMHALPADRGKEVVDSVIDGPHSVIYDEAENRLHTAKAVMALTIGGR